MNIIKKFSILLVLFLPMLFISCVTLKEPEITKKGDLTNYQYVFINQTKSLTSNVGTTINGVYVSEGKTVNPSDIISSYLIKKGYVILTDLDDSLMDKTFIVNYGESGRREVLFGYTTEITLQFIAANTKSILCVSTAEGIGDTEADDIKKAITRALDAIFQ